MKMPPNESPVWRLATLTICLGTVLGYMHLAYANGFDPLKDGGQLVATLLAYGTGSGIKTIFAQKPPTDEDA